jgi:hypothetical protein
VSGPAPAGRLLGRRLLEYELGGAGERAAAAGPAAAAAAAERALHKLSRPLGRLVGAEGYLALVRRALHLAQSGHPLLRDVRVRDAPDGAHPAGTLTGLAAAVRGAGPPQAGDALAAVLAHVLGLLVTFIGGDLTTRTLRDVWPDLPDLPDDPGDAAPPAPPAPPAAPRLGGETGAAPEEASP